MSVKLWPSTLGKVWGGFVDREAREAAEAYQAIRSQALAGESGRVSIGRLRIGHQAASQGWGKVAQDDWAWVEEPWSTIGARAKQRDKEVRRAIIRHLVAGTPEPHPVGDPEGDRPGHRGLALGDGHHDPE